MTCTRTESRSAVRSLSIFLKRQGVEEICHPRQIGRSLVTPTESSVSQEPRASKPVAEGSAFSAMPPCLCLRPSKSRAKQITAKRFSSPLWGRQPFQTLAAAPSLRLRATWRERCDASAERLHHKLICGTLVANTGPKRKLRPIYSPWRPGTRSGHWRKEADHAA